MLLVLLEMYSNSTTYAVLLMVVELVVNWNGYS